MYVYWIIDVFILGMHSYMEDADQSSTSNGRATHNVGRLGNLIRVYVYSLLKFAFGFGFGNFLY